ncbi:MAG TPA: hypothetical protein VF517_08230 [Thermoleophilaceae bacterium]|jgi:hypothetical protein
MVVPLLGHRWYEHGGRDYGEDEPGRFDRLPGELQRCGNDLFALCLQARELFVREAVLQSPTVLELGGDEMASAILRMIRL